MLMMKSLLYDILVTSIITLKYNCTHVIKASNKITLKQLSQQLHTINSTNTHLYN